MRQGRELKKDTILLPGDESRVLSLLPSTAPCMSPILADTCTVGLYGRVTEHAL
jgi:hypothetical protein